MTIILLLVTLITCVMAFGRPWIGVIAYYTLAVMAPQGIWPWIFDNYRISLMIAVSTFLGAAYGAVSNQLNTSALKHRQNFMLVVVFLMIHMSDMFSPFADQAMPRNMIPPSHITDIFNKIFVFYFIAITAINDEKKLKVMFLSLAVIGMYYAYWCNQMFFSGLMYLLNTNGRLAGPDGVYHDENALGMLLVTCMPFIYYAGVMSKNMIVKLGFWAFIPLLWHGVFLAASRGSMIALAAATLFIAIRSRSKMVGIVIIIGLIGAIMTQAANVVSRGEQTGGEDGEKEITFSSDESAADPRLISWRVGFDIMADYPLLGTGVGRFQQAFPTYSATKVHVAHNTFIQFGADSGLLAGIIYILFFYFAYKNYRKLSKELKADPNDTIFVLNEALAASMMSFFICAVFLNLMIYEILYFLLILNLLKQKLLEIRNNTPQVAPAPG